MNDVRTELVGRLDTIIRSSGRRDFLRLAAFGGMGALLTGSVVGCSDSLSPDPSKLARFSLATTSGPLNMIYAYAQFMWDFYTRISTPTLNYPGMIAWERQMLQRLLLQKRSHVKVLRRAIQKRRVSDTLLFDFETVNFLSRESAMNAAQTFEDLGVAMINGLPPLFTNPTDLVLCGKIASVWARHAALVRDLNYITGVVPSRATVAGDDVVDPDTGLSQAKDPQTSAAIMQPYFITTLAVN